MFATAAAATGLGDLAINSSFGTIGVGKQRDAGVVPLLVSAPEPIYGVLTIRSFLVRELDDKFSLLGIGPTTADLLIQPPKP